MSGCSDENSSHSLLADVRIVRHSALKVESYGIISNVTVTPCRQCSMTDMLNNFAMEALFSATPFRYYGRKYSLKKYFGGVGSSQNKITLSEILGIETKT